MKNTFLFIFAIILPSMVLSQDVDLYLQTANKYTDQKKYASAHQVLDSSIRTVGFHPALVNRMIENVLSHYFLRRDFKIFYLKDEAEKDSKSENAGMASPVAIRYPERFLIKVMEREPLLARTYKLLGDFYNLQLSEVSNSNLASVEKVVETKERVLANYLRAVQLGLPDLEANLWLGKYYLSNNQIKLAGKYLQAIIDQGFDDPRVWCYLAEINLQEKKYTQCYNDALKALLYAGELELDLRYKATRLAALSLYQLDEETRFLEYITECLRLSPDNQDAYLDLLAFYDSRNEVEKAKTLVREMLMQNPYDEGGYKYLERFIVKQNDYGFGEKLFEEMTVWFEHSDEVMGNIYRFRGNLFFYRGQTEQAKNQWDISRKYFSRFLPEDSPVLKQVGDVSRESSAN
jgi:hypothetical protein